MSADGADGEGRGSEVKTSGGDSDDPSSTANELPRISRLPGRASEPGAPHRPPWVGPLVGTLVGVLLFGWAIMTEAFSVTSEESSLWEAAEASPSEESWRAYVAWADQIRELGGARSMLATELTPVWRRAPEAARHIVAARAESLVATQAWSALCALLAEDHAPDVDATALPALRARLDAAIEAYTTQAHAHAMRAHALSAVTSALRAVRDDDPCADSGVLRVRRSIDPASDDLDHRLPDGETVRDLLDRRRSRSTTSQVSEAIATDLREALGGTYGLEAAHDDEAMSRARLVVEVGAVLHANGRVVVAAGSELPELALRVSVRFFVRADEATMPSEPDYQATSELAVPATVSAALARVTNVEGAESAYGEIVDALDARLTERVLEELGLATWSGPSSPYYDCTDAEPLPIGRRVRGTTRGALDVTYGTCSPEYERDRSARGAECDDCEPAPESPEVVYRLIVPERAIAAVQAFGDGRAIVTYVRRECAASTSELACGAYGAPASALLDPGVYYVFVDGAQGSSGRYELEASLHDPTHAPHACETAGPLALGSDTSVDTSSGLDHMEGSCGGVGSPERVYALDVPARSRLRCTRSGSVGGVVYVRSACGDPSTERACADASAATGVLHATLDRGRYYVVVDGHALGDRGQHTLRCDLAEIPEVSSLPAESCVAPGVLPATSVIQADTFAARDDLEGSCGGAGPDLVYRIDVAARSHLVATPTGEPGTILYLRRTCDDAESELACMPAGPLETDLDAGSYFLVVDGGATSFGPSAVAVTLTPL